MRFRNKTVLVTGGAGFIGSNLAIRLLEEGAKVRVVDSLLPELGGNLFNLSTIKDKISFHKVDLRDSDQMIPLVAGCDYIFNLAGNVSHMDSMKWPILDNALNTQAQIHFLEVCREHNPSALILFASTRQVYGTPKYLPVDENHPINPIDVNGINKLAAEYYHYLYGKIYGMRTICLRLTNTYGPRQLIKNSRQGFIGWFANRAILGEEIQLFGGGDQVRDFNYVDDVSEAFMSAALSDNCLGKIFILSGERASLATVAEMLIKQTGKGSVKKVPFPPEKKKIDIGDYYGVSELFYKASGWQPRTNLLEGLKRMAEYYLENSAHYLKD